MGCIRRLLVLHSIGSADDHEQALTAQLESSRRYCKRDASKIDLSGVVELDNTVGWVKEYQASEGGCTRRSTFHLPLRLEQS